MNIRLLGCLGMVAVSASSAGCGGGMLNPDGGGGGGSTGGGGTGGTAGAGGAFVPTRDVDLLFMIDNSSSTRLLQTNLLNNFPTFITTLQNQTQGLPNIHIAVITSD